MTITSRSIGGVTVLELTGRLAVSPAEVEVGPLRTTIGELIRAGCVDIAVNMAGLTYLDARGLGELVVAMKTLRGHGGRLMLVAPSARVARMLSVTGLNAVFERCDSEAELRRGALRPCERRAQANATAYA